MRKPAALGRSYYETIKAIADGIPQCDLLLGQLEEALGPFPMAANRDSLALEIGCGVSMYCPGLLRAGYCYVGVDESEWATRFTHECFAVTTFTASVESLWGDNGNAWDLILAAHCLEHLQDSPGAIGHLAAMLKPGGEFWAIVPDDSDPVNPDHLWFFTDATLRAAIESSRLAVERMAKRKHVERENFLYVRARKPDA